MSSRRSPNAAAAYAAESKACFRSPVHLVRWSRAFRSHGQAGALQVTQRLSAPSKAVTCRWLTEGGGWLVVGVGSERDARKDFATCPITFSFVVDAWDCACCGL
jgi:hypothetical protein